MISRRSLLLLISLASVEYRVKLLLGLKEVLELLKGRVTPIFRILVKTDATQILFILKVDSSGCKTPTETLFRRFLAVDSADLIL